MDSILEQRKLK